MKIKNTLIIGSLLFISFAATAQTKTTTKSTPAKATTSVKGETPAAVDPAAAEKAWMAYMSPGEMHKKLAMDDGDWNEEITFWMDPMGDPTKADVKCTNRMILDGRYQESVHTGMMMGMPFEGHGTIGFDNALQTFQSTWVDNMGTGISFLQGKWDEKTSSITLSGKVVDPETGKLENMRQVFRYIDDNIRLLEMFSTKNGKEFKSMEIRMSR